MNCSSNRLSRRAVLFFSIVSLIAATACGLVQPVSRTTAEPTTELTLPPTVTSTPLPSLVVTPASTPTATSTTVTATAAPPTVAPTATVPPTPTAGATTMSTPASVPTSSTSVTPEEQAYIQSMQALFTRWQTFSSESNALMNDVGQDPLKICVTRSGDIDAQIAAGRALLADVNAVSAPTAASADHQTLIREGEAALDSLTEAKTALCSRLDVSTALTKATAMQTHMTSAMTAASNLLAWVQSKQ